MGDRSGIQWTDATWNPITGCSKVSPGCAHCYAESLSLRHGWSKLPWHEAHAGENVVLHPDRLDLPLRWQKPRLVFVNSMSDLFHHEVLKMEVADRYGRLIPVLASIFATMAMTPQHTYQILTKRPGIMAAVLREPRFRVYVNAELLNRGVSVMPGGDGSPWPANIWCGTSVENQHWADIRIPQLLATSAKVRFLSCEPLLGPVSLKTWLGSPRCWRCGGGGTVHMPGMESGQPGIGMLMSCGRCKSRLSWVIVGGESGTGHRPMDPAWAKALRDECSFRSIPFFFKQHGGHNPKAGGRELDGRTWDEMPFASGTS